MKIKQILEGLTDEQTVKEDDEINEQDCWDGYAPGAQTGVKTKPGTGKNKGKRVNNCEPKKK